MIDTNALRKKVLDLAIRGKLVPQNPNDEPASVLLERIREEKQRLIREGKIKKDKVDSIIFRGEDNCHYEKFDDNEPTLLEDLPFELPNGWAWCRVSSFAKVLGGKRIPAGRKLTKENTGHLYIRVCDMKNETVILDELLYVPQDIYPNIRRYIIEKDDIYITVAGTIGNVGIIPDCLHGANLTENADRIVFRHIDKNWFVKCLQSQFLQEQIKSATATKTGQPKLAIAKIENLIIPLPPLNEQVKIIQSIKNIFNYIDLIEQNQKGYNSLVDALKKAILQSAIQGMLVEQCEDDEPASVLLEKIRQEKKAQLGKKYVESYIYKGDDNRYYEHINGKSSDITEDISFELPSNWCWARWGDISESIQYGYNAPAKDEGRIKMVRISDIQNGKVIWESVPYCDIDEEDINNYTLKAGDILFARTGGTVGKSYLVTEVPEEAIYAGYLIRTRYSNQLSSQYLKCFMETNLYWLQLTNGTTATAQPNCNGKTLGKMLLPIPPLAEQERIVNKINEIFAQL